MNPCYGVQFNVRNWIFTRVYITSQWFQRIEQCWGHGNLKWVVVSKFIRNAALHLWMGSASQMNKQYLISLTHKTIFVVIQLFPLAFSIGQTRFSTPTASAYSMHFVLSLSTNKSIVSN